MLLSIATSTRALCSDLAKFGARRTGLLSVSKYAKDSDGLEGAMVEA